MEQMRLYFQVTCWKGNKEVVTSLREIAAGFVKPDYPDESSEELGLGAGVDLGFDATESDPAEVEADPDS